MTKICSNCGKINVDEDKFCGECGGALAESTEITKTKENDLGYLVCNDCGGLYKLQPGESANDFDSCECGGKLIHTQDPTANKSTSQNTIPTSTNNLKQFIIEKINLKVLIVGIILCIVSFLYFQYNIMNSLMWKDVRFNFTLIFILISLIVGLLLYKKDYYTVALNGAILGLVPFFFILIYNMSISASYPSYLYPAGGATFGAYDTWFSPVLDLIFYPIIGAIFAIIGGFTTNIILKKIQK